jgi:hypothetical protein
MQAYWGVDVYIHIFLDPGTSWRWVVCFTLRPPYPRGKSRQYPLDRRLGGPQSQSGRHGEVKILDPTGTRNPTPRSSSPWSVTIPTELSRLPYIHFCSYIYIYRNRGLCPATGLHVAVFLYNEHAIATQLYKLACVSKCLCGYVTIIWWRRPLRHYYNTVSFYFQHKIGTRNSIPEISFSCWLKL